MKTKKTLIIASLIALFCAAAFFSCEGPIGLGQRLDIEGPVVEFISPAPRETVSEQFDIEGTVFDNSPIETLLLRASLNNEDFAKQWRYTKNSGWQVSEDKGKSWAAYSANGLEWKATGKSVTWTIPIDMIIGEIKAQDGEYTFTVQAWDTGGFSDNNSLKTLVLIYDTDPPKVDVFNPPLYSRFSSYDPITDKFSGNESAQELQSLRDKTDWKEPSLLGKFLTQEFQLQWQIVDNHDIASIEIRFYEHDVVVDGLEETEIPDENKLIYSYRGSNSPNGSIWVPNLSGNVGQYNEAKYGGGEIKKPITESKTTIKVVAFCYDMAGHVNQEKGLGYFIFWPEAAIPWIDFTDGMRTPQYYIDKGPSYTEDEFKEDSFMIYPGRSIKATAFQAQGASKVEYSLYEYDLASRALTGVIDLSYLKIDNNFTDELNADEKGVTVKNSLRPNGSYSTIFPWAFTPPPRSGFYGIRAKAYDFDGNASDFYEAIFRVQDITFPDFPEPPQPAASIPLFKAISQNKITISGIVSDATEVVSLYIVWINPQSQSYSAMSQLSYFRDSGYVGWKQAVEANLSDGNFILENKYDDGFPNKVWKVPVTPAGEDYQTFRKLYSYEQEIDITQHLNIAGSTTSDNQPLISQVFLLRAENPDGRCTIITYAPQGDTLHPKIGITRVTVTSSDGTTTVCNPGEYQQVPIFSNGDRIYVEGTWEEDSTEILPIQTYLTPNVKFEINRTQVTGTLSPAAGNAVSGTFTINALVGTHIDLASMKDTLSVSATIKDIGGNPAEDARSWLIESDTLKFLRISSEKDDGAYRDEENIDIFIEFNKPVTLKHKDDEDIAKPVLILNTGGRAYYKSGQETESPRQYFTYTVGAGENTPADSNGNPTQFLNVTGISIDGGNTTITSDTTLWQAANYPFTWENTLMSGDKDEIRLTRANGHNGSKPTNSFYARTLPITTILSDSDYMFTLGGGKRIQIDNDAPRITSFTASPQGWYRVGADIYITATFNKDVKLGSSIPRLTLSTNGQTSNTLDADVRVNNNQITFKYTVLSTDNTGTSPLQVSNFSGQILDIPGTPMAGDAVTSMTAASRTLNGVYLDNTASEVPAVTVWQGTAPTNNAAPGGTALGTSSTAAVALGNLYHDNLFVRIAGSAGNENLGRLEYSLDGGTNWTSLTSTGLSGIGAVNIPITSNGDYTVRARQIDQAGNIATANAGASFNVTFTRDPGSLITRISSTSPNGTYTHNQNFGNGNKIPITIYFRRAVSISAVTGITLNAVNGAGNGTPITVTAITGNLTDTTELTFEYTVANETAVGSNNGNRMPAGVDWLDVTSIGTITATDGTTDGGTNKDVTAFFALPAAGPTTTKLRLGENKEIRVESGALTRSSIAFKTTSAAGVPTLDAYDTTNGWVTGAANEGNAKFQGIRSDDGSFWTTLEIQFNHAINKGSGEITIEQIAGIGDTAAYRLPIVLTESQYNRFRGVASAGNSAENFNKYYTKGTNGYINGQGSDTSTKYVLNYNNNPNSLRPAAVFTGDVVPDSGFITAFRQAERITINVNAQAVEINGTMLKVRLTGSNAPQVPGATYNVRYPAGLVTDNLGNESTDSNGGTNTSMSDTPGAGVVVAIERPLGGVAKPFVRIKKTQDIIDARRTASATTPTLTAQQPQNAYVRMDSRTPNSSIVYWANPTYYTVTNGMTGNWSVTTGPVAQTAATRPTITGNGTSMSGQITIGDNQHRGIKWWVVARATATVGGTAYTSSDSDEMAYRTAITYRLHEMARLDTTGQILIGPNTGTGQNIVPNVNGGQIWIRGGDSIGSSSIPGFPFTWEDDFASLRANQKRAGIRLMTKNPATTGNLTDSTWEFLSWEINATAYIDIILGLDNTQNIYDYDFYPSYSIDEVWQYGPRYWTLQRAGWSSSKSLYPIYPGEIRYLDTAETYWNGKGPMNFSSAFKSRPSQSANGGVAGWTTTIPNPNTN